MVRPTNKATRGTGGPCRARTCDVTLTAAMTVAVTVATIVVAVVWAAAMGGAAAQTSLVEGVRKYEAGDYAGAVAEWRPLAERGDADALFNLGQVYRLGRGVDVDLDRASGYYREAALRGHADAQGNLGTLYFFDRDANEARRQEAVSWWLKAAERGNHRSQYMLGVLHWNGDHVAVDPVRGYAWMTLAAGSDLAEARAALDQMTPYLSREQTAEATTLAATLVLAPEERRLTETSGVPGIVSDTAEPAVTPADVTVPKTANGTPAAPDAAADGAVFGTAGGGRALADATPDVAAPPDVAEQPTVAERPQTADGWWLQIASLSNRDTAAAYGERLGREHARLLRGLDQRIVPADLGGRGVFYRVQVGPLTDRAAARERCVRFEAAGLPCLPIAP